MGYQRSLYAGKNIVVEGIGTTWEMRFSAIDLHLMPADACIGSNESFGRRNTDLGNHQRLEVFA